MNNNAFFKINTGFICIYLIFTPFYFDFISKNVVFY